MLRQRVQEETTVAPLPTRSSSARSQTVERAGLILGCFTPEHPHLTLAELAKQLELNESTAYRYIVSLQQGGLLERDRRQGGYRIGLRVIELAGIALNQIEVRKHALDDLDSLRDQTCLMANLGVLIEGDVLHLAQSPTKDIPRMYTVIGRRAVAHCTALGKVLLAHLPWREARARVKQFGWRPYTTHSICNFNVLQRELEAVCKRGYAIDCEERRLGVMCAAAPIRERGGRVIAAVSASGPRDRVRDQLEAKVLPAVLEAAHHISFRLGHQGNSGYL